MIAFGVLMVETWRTRRGTTPPDVVTVASLTGTRGFHLAWWGWRSSSWRRRIDDLWHRLFGTRRDALEPLRTSSRSPARRSRTSAPCSSRSRCTHPAGRDGPRSWAAESCCWAVLTSWSIRRPSSPSSRRRLLLHPRHLGSLAFTFALVLSWPDGAEPRDPLALAVGALAVQVTIMLVGDLGAILEPTPAIEEAIAADPTSPVALALRDSEAGTG